MNTYHVVYHNIYISNALYINTSYYGSTRDKNMSNKYKKLQPFAHGKSVHDLPRRFQLETLEILDKLAGSERKIFYYYCLIIVHTVTVITLRITSLI